MHIVIYIVGSCISEPFRHVPLVPPDNDYLCWVPARFWGKKKIILTFFLCTITSCIIVLNVAAGKAPMQSSVAGGGVPERAVDGSTSNFFTPETCSLTEVERAPWWYVNLLEPYMVQLVRLDFGKPCCGKKFSNQKNETIFFFFSCTL